MTMYQVNVLNPKAARLLQDLADMDLISIEQVPENSFLAVINQLRAKASRTPPSLELITKEMDAVRSKRYAKNNG